MRKSELKKTTKDWQEKANQVNKIIAYMVSQNDLDSNLFYLFYSLKNVAKDRWLKAIL